MYRPRAVRSLLIEEVGGFPRAGDEEPAEERRQQLEALARGRRRALLMVVVDLAAIVILFAFRRQGAFLELAATEEGVFSLGVVALAVHAGFRLGQLEKYRAVARACEELEPGGE